MARYNSVNSISSVAGGNTITTPASGLLTTLVGSGTVTIPNPVLYTGQPQTYFNTSLSTVTISTPSGFFYLPITGTSTTVALPSNSTITVVSDGTNYIIQDWLGGTVSTANLVATGGTINAVNIGATTTGTGAFSSLTATGTLSTSATTVATLGTTGTGALQVAGGASVAGIFNVGGASYYAGNVSVGTSSTSHRLTVQGNTNAVAAQVLPQGALPDNNDNAGLYVLHQGTAGTGLRVRTDNALTGTIFAHVLVNNAGAGINGFQVSQYGTGFIADFNKGGLAANSVRINNSGNMGIGTTSPGATLDMGSRTDAVILPVGTTAQRPTGVNGMMRKNSTTGAVEHYDPTTTSWIALTSVIQYDVLVVAGGGGTGHSEYHNGGGGAGGLIYTSGILGVGQSYVITVGAGGTGGTSNSSGDQTAGNNSIFGSLTAFGGGKGGGHSTTPGGNGGSGGGGAENGAAASQVAGTGTAGQGNAGGRGYTGGQGAGGGGGAGAVGGEGVNNNRGGLGGIGLQYAISGSNVYYAGGGSGSNYYGNAQSAGSQGGGGPGWYANGSGAVGTNGAAGSSNGTPNTGGGAGGYERASIRAGAVGGSGIVIIRIPSSQTATFSVGLTVSLNSGVAGYKIYSVTSGTGTMSVS